MLCVLKGIEALVRVSEGDLRKAITYLQSAARLNSEQEITEKIIIEIAGVSQDICLRRLSFSTRGKIFKRILSFKVVPPKVIENVLQICYRGHFEKLELAVKVRFIVSLCLSLSLSLFFLVARNPLR